MKIKHSSLVGTFEQKKAQVAEFNLIHDDFFAIVMKDKEVCEYVLKILLGRPVKALKIQTQYALRNLPCHSVVLDVLVEDDGNKLYNVEIQVADNDDHVKRLRYYQAAIDWSMLQKGRKYYELTDLYLLYITTFDLFGLGKACYEVQRIIKNTDIEADNGVHEMYFNTQSDDGTQLSEMLKYFRKSDPENDRFGALSKAVNYYKSNEKGVADMCQAVRDYGDEREARGEAKGIIEGELKGKVETIKNMLNVGLSLEQALKLTELDEKTYSEYLGKCQKI